MSGATEAAARRSLALHLEELRRDGVWGLPLGAAREAEAATAADEAPATGGAPGVDDERGEGRPEGHRAESRGRAPRPVAEGAPGPSAGERSEPATPATGGIRREADLFDEIGSPHAGADESLEEIRPEVEGCTLCRLSESRTNVVFGVGDPDARLMFIGEGPGRDEDLQGEPFVGKAGRLLDKIIAAMGMERDEVYIANTVKCRPPQNRNPRDDELDACRPYLDRQIAVIQPRVIVLLGRVAVQSVLGLDAPLSRLRGRFHSWRGIDVMCTYHPAYLLRNPRAKRMVWEDVQRVMERLAGEGPRSGA